MPKRFSAGLVVLMAIVAALTLFVPTARAGEGDPIAPADDEAGWLYTPDTVVAIDLTIPPASRAALEADPYSYVSAGFTLRHGDLTFGPWNVKLKLKGRIGSFRDLNGKAAFKLKFSNAAQRVAGREKMTLNNMVQDPSKIHETLAYELFRGLGIAAPRTGYAVVTVDGTDFGLYLNLETPDAVMLRRWYGQGATQHLYEGSYGLWTDVADPFSDHYEVDEGDEDDRSDLAALIAAAQEPGDGWLAAADAVADLRQFARMWAAERYIGHWDGYSNVIVNNYYLHSTAGGVFTMLPWGVDQTFSARLDFDDPSGGPLFVRSAADPATRALYAEELAAVREKVAELRLAERAASVFASIADEIAADTRAESGLDAAQWVRDETIQFLADRGGDLDAWRVRRIAPPAGLAAASIARGASLAWQAAAAAGPDAVTGYRVRYRQGLGAWRTLDVEGAANVTAELDGLADGGRYEFRVAAVTPRGVTRYSSSAFAVAGAPWAVSLETPRRAGRRISVTWTPPEFRGKGVLLYDVEVRDLESSPWRSVVRRDRTPLADDGTHSVTIDAADAPPGSTVRVRARNASGPGPWATTWVRAPAAPPPAGVAGLAMWLDASRLRRLGDGSAVRIWSDVSGNGNDAVRTRGRARLRTGVLNGRDVVEFPAEEASFTFPRISAIRTVFWVVRKAPGSGMRFLLGDDTEYHFHTSDDGSFLWGGYTHGSILAGTTRLMGDVVDGTTTALPEGSFRIVSVVTTGDVQANTLSEDRVYGRTWVGDVAEVLVYSRELTPAEEAAVGAALAAKYGLTTAYDALPE